MGKDSTSVHVHSLVLGLKPHSDGNASTSRKKCGRSSNSRMMIHGCRVPVIPEAIPINIAEQGASCTGDTVSIMSNGLFKSPIQRAVIHSERRGFLWQCSVPQIQRTKQFVNRGGKRTTVAAGRGAGFGGSTPRGPAASAA
ncbi:hypothetical protein JCGZ_17003 [Jatropha curcas]|uniref:Uncharacterized protein n=1 Tax=Jatropha curcas TaxID=180498 RepID=A0A067K208_JATCU|nr:hypothetical protein JCGZ_17003 [Jatropha curcas]